MVQGTFSVTPQQEAEQVRRLISKFSFEINNDSTGAISSESQRVLYYLLSINWFEKWKEKVHYDAEFTSSKQNNQDSDLPILNNDLVDHEFLESYKDQLIQSDRQEFSIINTPLKKG